MTDIQALDTQASTIVRIVNGMGEIAIADLLTRVANIYRTTPGHVKYALSYGNVKNMYIIDFDAATVKPND